jgi:hypothetical protein
MTMPNSHNIDTQARQFIGQMITTLGYNATARTLGISRGVLAAYQAGLPVRAGSRALILERLRRAQEAGGLSTSPTASPVMSTGTGPAVMGMGIAPGIRAEASASASRKVNT